MFQVNDRADGFSEIDLISADTRRGGDPVDGATKSAALPESNMASTSDNKAKLLAAEEVSSKGNKVIVSTEAQSKSSSSNPANRATDSPSKGIIQGQHKAESKHGKSKAAASKYSKDVPDLPAVVHQENKAISNHTTPTMKAGNKNGSHDAAAKEPVSPLPANPAVHPNAAIDGLLNELKDKHKMALANLQNIVDGDSLKRVKPLEDRLVMRRLQLADRKKAADSVNSGVDTETEQRFITALKDEIGEIQTEIEEAQVKAQRTKEGFGCISFRVIDRLID